MLRKLAGSTSGYGLLRLFFTVFVLANVAFVGWTLYSHYNTERQVRSTQDIVMTVGYVGGLCPDNKACSSYGNVYIDGVFEGRTPLTDSELVQLKQVIRDTDFTKYPKNAGSLCPSAVDGSDLVLRFPQKYPDQSFKPCTLDIPKDDPAIGFIYQLLDSHQKL